MYHVTGRQRSEWTWMSKIISAKFRDICSVRAESCASAALSWLVAERQEIQTCRNSFASPCIRGSKITTLFEFLNILPKRILTQFWWESAQHYWEIGVCDAGEAEEGDGNVRHVTRLHISLGRSARSMVGQYRFHQIKRHRQMQSVYYQTT